MDPAPSKRRSGFRKFLGDQADRLLNRSSSSAASQQPPRIPGIHAPSPAPQLLPVNQTIVSPCTDTISDIPAVLPVAPPSISPLATNAIPLVSVDLQGEPPMATNPPTAAALTCGDKSQTLAELQPATKVQQEPEPLEVPNSLSSASSCVIPNNQSREPPCAISAPAIITVQMPNADLNVSPPPMIPSSLSTSIPHASPNHVKLSPVTEQPNENKDQGGSLDPLNSVERTNEQAATRVWRGLGAALETLNKSAKLFPPIQSSVSTFLSCINLMGEISRNQQECEELASEITRLTELLAERMGSSTSARMSGSIANFGRGIEEQAKLIKRNQERGTAVRLMDADAGEELVRCYRRIASLFRQLQARILLSILERSLMFEQIDASLSVWETVNDQMAHTLLRELAPVKLANYDSALSTSISRRTCTEGTRTVILSGLTDWSRDPDAADIYWMNGMAGTGKTTIACTFSESLEERKQLAASFFCTRALPECRMVTRIIPTIAYQLAQYSVPFQSVLCEVLREDPNAGAKSIAKQFERLLRQPLLKVKEAIPSGLVVTIDALDECDDMREVELLLSVLLKSAGDIPLWFFVTSRPEPEIYNRMLARTQGCRTVMHLHEVEKSLVQADIELYLGTELDFASPTHAQVKELARRSGALFIYAATLVRYIGTRKAKASAQRRLHSVLSMTSEPTKQYAEVDALYAAVLKAALDGEGLEAHETEHIRWVLQTVICIREPVSIEVLTTLARLDDEEQTSAALEPLRAVIHLSETTGLVSTLHASFPDFMFDETRSGPFFCRFAVYNETLTRQCFELMGSHLRFNICRLESSFRHDREVDDLAGRVGKYISPMLLYACRYWGDHLNGSKYTESLSTMLDDFLSSRLLFWMEVLNLTGYITTGADVLLRAKQWLQIGSIHEERARAAEDARNFVTSFASQPVSQSTPHIYISSLPFCPKSSTVFKHYWKKTKGLIVATGSAMNRRDMVALATWQTESEVLAIAYSPDGIRVAVGGPGGTIAIRDAYTGTLFIDPLKGHDDRVLSVAYSPDGSCIASGSDDKTIRVWNTYDGAQVTSPFVGHTSSVWSVAYSPDGTRIVSGSYDRTLRMWNARDGTPIAGPFQGHSSSVWSVAFSPDGTRVVSGSNDKTIRVWNAHDGALVCGPFVGHTDLVRSVAYSPDGAHIVSGSFDKTIRVWDATSGELTTNPLQGHHGTILSVAYSPDGGRIVSGSNDNTIRVWCALDGRSVAGPFKGHTGFVRSVAFSPDGTRIVSGSYDRTIRVWSAQGVSLDNPSSARYADPVLPVARSPDGTRISSVSDYRVVRVRDVSSSTLAAEPFKGHNGSVNSVAYSPDGTRIASGSSDGTIRVWNARNSAPVTKPFEGHAGAVMSVAYSLDGTRIASGSLDGTIRVWDAFSGAPATRPFEGHADSVLSVAYSPDGTRISSGSSDGTIRVWDAFSGAPATEPLKGHNGSVKSVAYSPDGTRIASGSLDATIRVWDAFSGTPVTEPFKGHDSSVNSVAYSPDGSRIASASDDDTIRVWDALSGMLITEPIKARRYSGATMSVTYSPDGTRITCGSWYGIIQVCDALGNLLVAGPFSTTGFPLFAVAYSPDGTRIVAAGEKGITQVWDAVQATSADRLFTNYREGGWPTEENGWTVCSDGRLFWWLPFDLRSSANVLQPWQLPSISSDPPTLTFDYGDVLIGERWVECYQSR